MQRALQKQRAHIVGMDVNLHAYIRCYSCNGFGNYVSHFPVEAPATSTGAGFLNMEMDMIFGYAQYINEK